MISIWSEHYLFHKYGNRYWLMDNDALVHFYVAVVSDFCWLFWNLFVKWQFQRRVLAHVPHVQFQHFHLNIYKDYSGCKYAPTFTIVSPANNEHSFRSSVSNIYYAIIRNICLSHSNGDCCCFFINTTLVSVQLVWCSDPSFTQTTG